MFGDSESLMNEDVPVVISRKATGDWDEPGGLGISSEEAILDSRDLPKAFPPNLLHEESAPARMEIVHKIPIRQRSSEKIQAKRESIERHRHECVESGDDEDDDQRGEEPVEQERQEREPEDQVGAEAALRLRGGTIARPPLDAAHRYPYGVTCPIYQTIGHYYGQRRPWADDRLRARPGA